MGEAARRDRVSRPIFVVAHGQAGRPETVPGFAPEADADGRVEAAVRDRDGEPRAAPPDRGRTLRHAECSRRTRGFRPGLGARCEPEGVGQDGALREAGEDRPVRVDPTHRARVVEPVGEGFETRQEGRRVRRRLALDEVPVPLFRVEDERRQGQEPRDAALPGRGRGARGEPRARRPRGCAGVRSPSSPSALPRPLPGAPHA
jgi:hypothetical protein